MNALEVVDLDVEVARDGSRIVDGADLSLAPGEIMGVVGESGSGKSTLALALLGFARPGAAITAGSVVVAGKNLLALSPEQLRDARRDLVRYVAQEPSAALNPSLRLRTQLLEGLPGTHADALVRVREILEAVGLRSDDAFIKRRPNQLSGGQQQRVVIAMAVAARPKLIVLDEPTTGLDVSTQARVLEMIARLCRENDMAAVYISHDLAVVAEVAHYVSVMYGGQIVETGTTEQVINTPGHPYSRALLDAVPSTRMRLRLTPIPGRAPAPGEHGQGCVFAPRCEFVIDACRQGAIEMVPTPAGGMARCIRVQEVSSQPRPTLVVGSARDLLDDRDAVLAVEGLNASYSGRPVLFDVSFRLAKGECLAIAGESGSGKTTLSRCLIGLHREQQGRLRFEGEPMPTSAAKRTQHMRQRLQYVFQNPYGSLNPRHTIATSIETAVRHFHNVKGTEARGRIREALERVEIPWRLAERYPAELSGGQRQRAAIARALVCEPSVLICDEVTSALDVSVQASVVELLRSLLDTGLSMVFVTHNLAVVRSIADSVAVLSRGRIVETGSTDEVLQTPEHEYTRSLMADALDVPHAMDPEEDRSRVSAP